MKRLRRFSYYEPATLEEAIATLAVGADTCVLAGGTDLVVDMKVERMRPSAVVNLKRIPGLSGIEVADGGTRIGALTKITAIERSSLVRERHPAISAAAGVLASPPVRGLATIGGNIGRASPASDLAPPLIVHRAIAIIEGRDGSREEAVEDLFLGPGVTTLSVDDVITSVFVPDSVPRFGSVHLKIGTRGGGTDIAVVGASAGVALDESGAIQDVRIVLASVAPTPIRALAAESALAGVEPSEELLAAAAEIAAGECRPISDLRASASHRLALAKVLTLRALRAAVAAAEKTEAA
jgi:carbon-monoxide dehydrogenase medium subunit